MKYRFLFLLASNVAVPVSAFASTDSSTIANPDDPIKLNRVVVNAGPDQKPLETVVDAKSPAQPIPAQDGADYLKSVPGFCVIRKGGIDGDPVLRGQGGSRLNILLDGQAIFGGCGNRMDPPTAYVFPSTYDQIVVIKGPQTVLHGPGASAGVVLFERETKRFTEPGVTVAGSLTAGSFGRSDETGEATAGTPVVYTRISGSHSTANDYKDGLGNEVHTNYRRWSGYAALGWTPDEHTLIELSAARSNGEAAYADRSMDGVKFLRNNVGLRVKKSGISPLVAQVEGSAYYNYADHVMDNYTLRPNSGTRMLMNPDRLTIGARGQVDLNTAWLVTAKAGLDYQKNTHKTRSNLTAPRIRDAQFDDFGLFGELARAVAADGKLIGGLRLDRWTGRDDRKAVAIGSGMMASTAPNPTAGKQREESLYSGFMRYEYSLLENALTAYVGVGTSARFPDYWELVNKESIASLSSFNTKPEQTTQLDAGLIYRKKALAASAAIFASRTKNYILVQNNYAKPNGMTGTRAATVVRDIDASTFGGELAISYTLAEVWKLDASLACVRGENRTDNIPLAQQPPLEGRIGVSYVTTAWFAGVSTRLVSAQNRFALNQGNIVGQDLGSSAGFAIYSLNAGWKSNRYLQITAGVDNLSNRTYAEFISRAGSSVTGFTTTTRINEPGRTLWIKLDLKY